MHPCQPPPLLETHEGNSCLLGHGSFAAATLVAGGVLCLNAACYNTVLVLPLCVTWWQVHARQLDRSLPIRQIIANRTDHCQLDNQYHRTPQSQGHMTW